MLCIVASKGGGFMCFVVNGCLVYLLVIVCVLVVCVVFLCWLLLAGIGVCGEFCLCSWFVCILYCCGVVLVVFLLFAFGWRLLFGWWIAL